MKTIKLFPVAGQFAENKDIARDIRLNEIIPILESGESLILDFENIDSITQSFCHALLSDLIRNYGIDVLDRVTFSNCSKTVSKIIEIVVDYMQ
jgi:STAS-like domain of unknown function (DUF4325)